MKLQLAVSLETVCFTPFNLFILVYPSSFILSEAEIKIKIKKERG